MRKRYGVEVGVDKGYILGEGAILREAPRCNWSSGVIGGIDGVTCCPIFRINI